MYSDPHFYANEIKNRDWRGGGGWVGGWNILFLLFLFVILLCCTSVICQKF
jgi:hypothetical protein